jgi:hypothetical protein
LITIAFIDYKLQASECMGLPYPGKQRDDNMDSFSHNILKFELSGPEYENFSVVDLPGLFRSKLCAPFHIMAKIRS